MTPATGIEGTHDGLTFTAVTEMLPQFFCDERHVGMQSRRRSESKKPIVASIAGTVDGLLIVEA